MTNVSGQMSSVIRSGVSAAAAVLDDGEDHPASLSLAQRLLIHTVNTLEVFLDDWIAETDNLGRQRFLELPLLSPCTAILSLPGIFDVWLEAERIALFMCLGFLDASPDRGNSSYQEAVPAPAASTVNCADEDWRRTILQQRDVKTLLGGHNRHASLAQRSKKKEQFLIKSIPRACRLVCHLLIGLITRVENVLVVCFDRAGNVYDPSLEEDASAFSVQQQQTNNSSSITKLLTFGTSLASGVQVISETSTASPSILRAVFVEKVLIKTIRTIHLMLLCEYDEYVSLAGGRLIAEPLHLVYLEIILVAGPLSHLLHDVEIALEPTLHQLHINSVGKGGEYFATIDERWDRVWVALQEVLMECQKTQDSIVERWVEHWCASGCDARSLVDFSRLDAAATPAFMKRLRQEAEGIMESSIDDIVDFEVEEEDLASAFPVSEREQDVAVAQIVADDAVPVIPAEDQDDERVSSLATLETVENSAPMLNIAPEEKLPWGFLSFPELNNMFFS